MLAALGGHGGQGALEADLNPAQTLIVSGGKDGGATLWNAQSKQKINSFRGHTDWVVHVGFTPNGKYVLTSSVDGTVRLWDPSTFRQVATVKDQTAVGAPICCTPDGKYLITVSVNDFMQVNTLTPAQPLRAAKTSRRRHRR